MTYTFNNNPVVEKVDIDYENKKLVIYYKQDNSHLLTNPSPPPSYFRKIYSFSDLVHVETQQATVERSYEKVIYPDLNKN
jgi:hypothetical protein